MGLAKPCPIAFNNLVLGEQRYWNTSIQTPINPWYEHTELAVCILNFANQFYSFIFIKLISSDLIF